MKQILYSAVDDDGRERSGYVDATSNSDALAVLSAQGLSEVEFHDDAALAVSRNDLVGLSDYELEAIARFEVNHRKNPGVSTFIIEVMRKNRLIIIAGACLFLWGLYDQNIYVAIPGALACLSAPLISIWNYRVVSNYDRLLRASAEGRWQEALELIETLRKNKQMASPEMAFDLDLRQAGIVAVNDSLETALQGLEKWRPEFEDQSPGMYEARVAPICHAAGQYQKYVDSMRSAFFKSSQSQVIILDLALAEARLGDPAKAAVLLKTVKVEELPVYGFGYLEWVQGMIDKRTGSGDPELHMSLALSAMLEFAESPAFWPGLAVCTGDYALCLAGKRDDSDVEEILSKVWTILCAQGEKSVIDELTRLYPGASAAG